MDVAKLILLVQNYPEVYNMRHPEYFNKIRRENCWEEIGGIMNQTGKLTFNFSQLYNVSELNVV